jgi:hypothetical protein
MENSNIQKAPTKLRKKKAKKQKVAQLESAIKSDIQWGFMAIEEFAKN